MAKKIKFTVIILILVVFLSSCIVTGNDLDICARLSVPGMLISDLKSPGYPEIIEEDSYGRTLYEYTLWNSLAEEKETVLVVLQKSDNDYVYYYEDLNYIFEEYGEEEISLLKEQNDWEKAFDESKMSRRSIKASFDGFIRPRNDTLEGASVRETIINAFSKKIFIDTWIVDLDTIGQEMWVVSVEENGETQMYFALVDLSYNVSVMEIEFVDGFIDIEAYSKFKHDNGWTYGW